MRRLRQDLDWLTSAGLLLAAGAAIVTGIASDVWDIRTFIPHVSMGYVMTILAIAHVVLNWDRLVGYGRFRARRCERPAGPCGRSPGVPERRRTGFARAAQAPTSQSSTSSFRRRPGVGISSSAPWPANSSAGDCPSR